VKAHIFFDMVGYCPRLASASKATCAPHDDEGFCAPPGIPAQSPELGAAYAEFLVLMIRLIGYRPKLLIAGGGAVCEALKLTETPDDVFSNIVSYILGSYS
jgi:hypothetical protein